MSQRADRGQATRQHIIETATRLFAEEGCEAVSIEALLNACGISRGALYHHFASKIDVFTAVLEMTEARVAAQIAKAASGVSNPREMLRIGCATWLSLAVSDATVRRVVLIDAPSVIGWQAWRTMDDRYSLGLLRAALTAAAESGQLRADRTDIYAHMLLAVLIEVSLMIARAPDDRAIAEAGRDAVDVMLEGMFV